MLKWVSVLCAGVLAAPLVTGASTPATAQGGGTIVGEVKFSGTPPAPKVTKVNKDNQVCGDEKRSEEVIVGANKGLQNAVVSVVGAKGPAPKPAQKPHPPILLGGETKYTLQRVVDLCDGWFPRGRNPELTLTAYKELQEIAARKGRDMKTISVSVFAAPPDEARLDQFRQAGATRAVLLLPPEGRDTVLPLLRHMASPQPEPKEQSLS